MKSVLKKHVDELQNVTWPTRKQALHSMGNVLAIMLLVGVFLTLCDYLLNKILLWIV